MLHKKGSVYIAAMIAVFGFLSVVYISCTKVGSAPKCNGVICQNGGYCKNGVCKCPAGYEGNNCSISSAARFFGTWDVHQTIIGSDSLSVVGKDTIYPVFLKKTATPTTFFIDNFLGNASYNDLLCTLDTLNSRNFGLDTLRDFNMWYEHVFIKAGSYGTLQNNDAQINAHIILRRLSATSNWRNDTLQMIFTPHKF